MLALYDICAVLTPCGPLKLLIQEAQRQQDDGGSGQLMPGLLFEVGEENEGRMQSTVQPDDVPNHPENASLNTQEHTSPDRTNSEGHQLQGIY